jgi:4-alpha-glucanotransferase
VKTTGILIPTFSTRREADLGIGDTLGIQHWIDWAAEYKVGFLQLLPINENGTEESPYSSISSIAIDPIYLCFDPPHIPFITQAEIDTARTSLGSSFSSHLIHYPAVRATKNYLLDISYSRFSADATPAQIKEFKRFRSENDHWLGNYCDFKLLIEMNGPDLHWDMWSENCRDPESACMFLTELRNKQATHIDSRLEYFAYVQWLCFRQWRALRAYADSKGVKLKGDVPIGIAFHSVDVFFNRSLFKTDWFGGTPPEGYSPTNPFIHEWGQNWGIPLYDWEAMAQDNYSWWRQRISSLTEIFHIFRIDHILGFYRIYAFPWHPRDNQKFVGLDHSAAASLTGGKTPRWFDHPDDTYESRTANHRNGDSRLRPIIKAAGKAEIIAEDLGWVPDYVRPHLTSLGIAGYRIPHWDSREDGFPVMGHEFPHLSFATYSTHDHDSLISIWENCRNTIILHKQKPTEQGHWAAEGAARALRLLARFSNIPVPDDNQWPPYSEAIHLALIKALLASNSQYALLMVTDLFSLRERINIPGDPSAPNWKLRINLDKEQLAERGRILATLIALTGRANHLK